MRPCTHSSRARRRHPALPSGLLARVTLLVTCLNPAQKTSPEGARTTKLQTHSTCPPLSRPGKQFATETGREKFLIRGTQVCSVAVLAGAVGAALHSHVLMLPGGLVTEAWWRAETDFQCVQRLSLSLEWRINKTYGQPHSPKWRKSGGEERCSGCGEAPLGKALRMFACVLTQWAEERAAGYERAPGGIPQSPRFLANGLPHLPSIGARMVAKNTESREGPGKLKGPGLSWTPFSKTSCFLSNV